MSNSQILLLYLDDIAAVNDNDDVKKHYHVSSSRTRYVLCHYCRTMYALKMSVDKLKCSLSS